ncbi:hypothetical protein [Snuella lapsa]|uniref:Lipoprotein n=1 Tax=Snuella lapsa TaxID=870481 RepID=A0ABP6YC81_9FLAO
MTRTIVKSTILLITTGITLLTGCIQTKNNTSLDSNETITNEKAIFRFSSNSNDVEDEVRILKTNNEISYHIFDFNKGIITMKSQSENGEWKTFEFKIKNFKVNEYLSGLNGMEFDIDSPMCFQVWVDTLGSIGYEFNNGQKLVFYGVQELE